MRRFFTKEERGCRVITEIREMVIFAPQSLIVDPVSYTHLTLPTNREV